MKALISGAAPKSALLKGASAAALAFTLAACTSDLPTPMDKPGDLPATFQEPLAKDAPLWPETTWWSNFKADELGTLEITAQTENLDVKQAAARVLQAEAQDGEALADLFPTLGANTGVTRQGQGHKTFFGSTTYSAGLSASYQQSFFGGEYFALQGARESLRASRYAAAVTGLTVESQVASQYFTVLALRERIAIAHSNVDAAKRILTITQAKVSSGVASNLDLAEEQAIVAGQEARVPALIEQEKEARYALAILMGKAPERYDVTAKNLDGVVSPLVQPGMPSELLLRRPDVAEAEAQLYSAHANVDAARAAFFPSLSLTGTGNYSGSTLSNLINPNNLAFNLAASVVQSIFDGGKIKAENDQAKAAQVELISAYRKTVFSAFSDVETALGSVQATTDELAFLQEETRADAEAFRISELQYREGTIDIVQLLNNQQLLFSAQDALISTKLERLQSNIQLYVVLGGGWKQDVSDASYQNQLDWWPL